MAVLRRQRSMQKSPIHPKLQAEFDPQLNFAQFLTEAKAHASEVNLEAATPHSCKEAGQKQLEGGQMNNKKSWKKSLFSWLKADKKSKHMPIPEEEPSSSSFNNSKQRRSAVLSGPIHGSGNSRTDRPRRPNSGPLLGLFNPTKRTEDKMPYICLNSPRAVQSYGPVYMVS